MPVELIKPEGWSNDDPHLTPAHMNDFQAKLVGLGSTVDGNDQRIRRSAQVSMRQLATGVTSTRALALASQSFPSYVRLFMGSDVKYYVAAEGTLVDVGSLPIVPRGVAQEGDQLISRIAAVGFSSTPLAYSDNAGATWTAVGFASSFGGNAGLDITHNGTLWLAVAQSTTNAIHSSPTAASGAWTQRSLNGTAGDIVYRIVSSKTTGRALCIGTNGAGTVAFMAQSADGITWSQVALPVGYTGVLGSLAWDPRGYFWWAAKRTIGGVRVYRSPDAGAVVWTAMSQNIGLGVYEISVDQHLGYIYLAGSTALLVSDDDGVTFHGITSELDQICAMGGMLFGLNTTSDILYCSALTLAQFSY